MNDLLLTSLRWGIGLSAAAGIGLLMALAEAVFAPALASQKVSVRGVKVWKGVIDFLRALPVIALVPVVQMIGVNEWLKISLIAWAAVFPICVAIRHAADRSFVDAEIAMVGLGLGKRELFWAYRLPKALTGLRSGIEISIGIAWISTVAAEWVGTFTSGFWAGGLGYRVVKAHDANDWAATLTCLAGFGLLGCVSAWSLSLVLGKLQPAPDA